MELCEAERGRIEPKGERVKTERVKEERCGECDGRREQGGKQGGAGWGHWE